GVVATEVEIDPFEKYLKKLPIAGSPELSELSQTFLMDHIGNIVIFPGESVENVNERLVFPLKEADNHSEIITHDNGSGKTHFDYIPFMQEPCTLFYATCQNDWKVGIAIPADWTIHLLTPIFINFLVGCVVALAIIIFVIYAICRRLNKPLVTLARVAESVGKGDFLAPLPDVESDDEIAQLNTSFKRMQTELIEYVEKLKKTVAAKERADAEINVAKTIQQDLLPEKLPPYENCLAVQAAASLIPAKGVGGDLYDAFLVDENHFAVIIGDVSGKGVPAALLMAVTQTMQRSISISPVKSDSQADSRPTINDLASRMNTLLNANNNANMFVTYWGGLFNFQTGQLTYTNAGHNPPLIKRKNGNLDVIRKRHGLPLGINAPFSYKSDTVQLEVGDTLILYTDGVTEAFNKAGEIFGEERLMQLLEPIDNASPAEIVSLIESAVFKFAEDVEQSDDITILVMQHSDDGKSGILHTETESGAVIVQEITLPAVLQNLNNVTGLFEELLEKIGCSVKEVNQVVLCVEEIFVNICNYAYGDEPCDVTIKYKWDSPTSELTLQFIDSGKQFDPLAKPDPDILLSVEERPIGGLGVFLVKKIADNLAYEYKNGHNILTIKKKLSLELGVRSSYL
ncbi:MAG: SpoIIE family protein phosphatase, partial [Thermoguttaceae bacterium]